LVPGVFQGVPVGMGARASALVAVKKRRLALRKKAIPTVF
jgi:hypothetical protein